MLEQARAALFDLNGSLGRTGITSDAAVTINYLHERYADQCRSDGWMAGLRSDLTKLATDVTQVIGSIANAVVRTAAQQIDSTVSSPPAGFTSLAVPPAAMSDMTIGDRRFFVIDVNYTPVGHPLRQLPPEARLPAANGALGATVIIGQLGEYPVDASGLPRLPAIVAVQRLIDRRAEYQLLRQVEAERRAARERDEATAAEHERLQRPVTTGHMEAAIRAAVEQALARQTGQPVA